MVLFLCGICLLSRLGFCFSMFYIDVNMVIKFPIFLHKINLKHKIFNLIDYPQQIFDSSLKSVEFAACCVW